MEQATAGASIADVRAMLATGSQRPAPGDACTVNGESAEDERVLAPGDVLGLGASTYRIRARIDGGVHPALIPDAAITAPVRLHAGLHKCMTQFTRAIYTDVSRFQKPLRRLRFQSRGFRHFYHDVRDFYARAAEVSITSLSGQTIDLDSFTDIRVVRFIRDPRDLIVSGYYYHKRGKEPWSRLPSEGPGTFDKVNGGVSPLVPNGTSLQSFLESSDLETGIRAEIDFRRPHYHSMMAWPQDDPRVLVLRYEDILGAEQEAADKIGRHFGWTAPERWRARKSAWNYSAGGQEAHAGHVRNKAPSQWREHFSDELNRDFVDEFGPLLEAYGYPME